MLVTYATGGAPGHANEDYAVCGNDWAVVLDGATALAGIDNGCIHDVRWLASHLAAAITRRMLVSDGDLRDILAAAIGETSEAHAATCDLQNPDSPSSTVAMARVRGRELDYLVLGDSPVVIRTPGEGLAVLSDDRLAHLPGGRPYSRELVRSLRNQPGGFWVASTNPEAAYQAVAGNVSFAAGAEVGLFTDGASRLVEFYGYEWEHVFSILDTSGPDGVITRVRAAERESPLQDAKQHDDATAVLLTGCAVERPAETRAQRPAHWRDLIGM